MKLITNTIKCIIKNELGFGIVMPIGYLQIFLHFWINTYNLTL